MRRNSIVALLVVCLLAASPVYAFERAGARGPRFRDQFKRFVRVISSLVPGLNGDILVDPRP